MKKVIEIQSNIASLILISLLVFVASCEPTEYALNVSILPAGSGTVNISPSGGIYEEGTEVTLSPMPNSDFLFESWSGTDASSVNNNKIVMSKDMNITADFQAQYSLNVNIHPVGSGTVNLSPGGGIYEEGIEVTLSPVPGSGFIFASWTGTDASMVNDDKIVMSKDMDIIANFEPETMIRLKSGSGLNPGASIYFVALSKDDNYFDLEDVWAFEKTDADWYIDGGVIPFTTDYKEFDLAAGEYYFLVRASGVIMRTTIDVISGKQTIEIYASNFGGISVRVLDETKSSTRIEEKSRRVVIDKR